MTQITKVQGAALKHMMQGDAWNVVMQLLGNELDTLRDQEVTGTNAFETLREVHTRQGKIVGLTDFFNKLERGAFDQE